MIIVLFGTPYAVKLFDKIPASIIVAYDEDPDAQLAAARVIAGDLKPTGRSPIKQ